MELILNRKVFNTEGDRATIGELLIDSEFFCYTLEDEVRPDGVKVYGETAIPIGEYTVELTYSNRFKRYMPLIYNTKDKAVEKSGVRFEGVRFHGGNKAIDTHGCPLVAFNTDLIKIWGTAEKALTKRIKDAGGKCKLTVNVKPFDELEIRSNG
tara:strand:+ start:5578 stop:6039 length:462 start_codon:yes stop_codon:yes gene_type:complete